MRKLLSRFLSALILTFFLAISTPLVAAQETPSSQPNSPTGVSAPVTLDNQTLFVFQTKLGNQSPEERARRTSQHLLEFAEDRSLSLEELDIYEGDTDGIPLTAITVDGATLFALSNQDAHLVSLPRSQLAQEYLQIIKTAIGDYRKERSVQYLLRAVLSSAIATLFLFIILFTVNNIFTRIYQKLKVWEQSYIRPVRIGDWELIRANQLDNIITWIIQFFQAATLLGLLIAYFTLVLIQFPWTRALGKTVRDSLFGTLQTGWQVFVNYLPNLLTITIVTITTYFLLRLSKSFFHELGVGTFSLPGFYAEWAQPTYRIFTFLVIALAAVVVFPLLPGFQSPAFQGISVFLGLLISLGSTSLISNLVSGGVLIYTRAFRVGDLIKIDDISGRVIETTLLVTRVLTPTNVVVSIPNSQISSSSIKNLSFSHRELNEPFIFQATVYLGYEVPWRAAYQALIDAARQTPGVAQSPEPFVMQCALNEVYVTYLLSVYVDLDYFNGQALKEIEISHSRLHASIRDCCAQAGIKIFAPSYEADPTNYGPVASLDAAQED